MDGTVILVTSSKQMCKKLKLLKKSIDYNYKNGYLSNQISLYHVYVCGQY